MYLYVAMLLFIPDQLLMNTKVSNIMFHSNNFVRRLLDFSVPFLFTCLYCSMTEFANEKPRIVIHLWTIISKQVSPASSSTFLMHAHQNCTSLLASTELVSLDRKVESLLHMLLVCNCLRTQYSMAQNN